jgi:hypothetical protein
MVSPRRKLQRPDDKSKISNRGSSLDDFLAKQGYLDQATQEAKKKVKKYLKK